MRFFKCDCGHPVFFENTLCLSCGASTGYDPAARTMVSLETAPDGSLKLKGSDAEAPAWKFCANLAACGCNWLVSGFSNEALCDACLTTRTIPALTTPRTQLRWQRVEAAKRRLLFTLLDLGLWGSSSSLRPDSPLTFDLLEAAPDKPVITGHQSGIITLDIAEADDDAREHRRVSLHEPYRTLSGHFRHEVGHYYWNVLIRNSPCLDSFRQFFGDETADYAQAMQRHYADGAPADWGASYVSAYATMHPWEDWAETWAHYLHMHDLLETADNASLSSRTTGASHDPTNFVGIEGATQANAVDFVCRVERWTSVGILCNELSRSMGQPDVYPFALTIPVLRKLFFIERVISRTLNGGS
jgi:hypothetical protein